MRRIRFILTDCVLRLEGTAFADGSETLSFPAEAVRVAALEDRCPGVLPGRAVFFTGSLCVINIPLSESRHPFSALSSVILYYMHCSAVLH